jgi:predicted transcriptional regulator
MIKIMNHELAKTLTTAIVQFIDRERPEGTMCCSNTECDALERAFIADNFISVESFIQKKLSRLTEFEQEVSDIVEYCKEHGENVAFDYAKRHAKTLLSLAKKELLKDDELTKKHLEGYIMGREDTMREMKDFIESHFNTYSGTSTAKAEG